MVDIKYGGPENGIRSRVVTITDLFAAGGHLFIDGFCHLRGEDRTFRLDRIHWISELPNGGYYDSCVAWLASYGVAIEVYEFAGGYSYRKTDR